MKLARLPIGQPEIFHSLQGEGISAGLPAVFVRASLCNLHCAWCDTDYTWNWVGTPWKHERDREPGYEKFRKSEQVIELGAAEIAEIVAGFDCRRLIATGGEPLLQQAGFAELFEILRSRQPGWTIEVETNGTIVPEGELDRHVDQYNVSPKLANSGNPEELRRSPEALAFLAASPKAWFKFVVAGPADLSEIEELRSRLQLDPERILLMPEGRDPETLAARRREVAELCRARGFRFSDRLHVALWGTARGR